MKRFLVLVLVLVLSGQANSQSVTGTLDCTVTGNIVVSSEQGKFKTYSSIQGGVKTNEKIILIYEVTNNSFYISLKRDQVGNNSIISEYMSTRDLETAVEKSNGGGFIFRNSKFGHSISFLPDYIRIKAFGEFFISRYYKNDWHGIYVDVNNTDSTTQTLTLNCRHANDKMDAAFKIFSDYKMRK